MKNFLCPYGYSHRVRSTTFRSSNACINIVGMKWLMTFTAISQCSDINSSLLIHLSAPLSYPLDITRNDPCFRHFITLLPPSFHIGSHEAEPDPDIHELTSAGRLRPPKS